MLLTKMLVNAHPLWAASLWCSRSQLACLHVSSLCRPAEPGHGPGFSHAPVAQTRRPAGSPQSSASLATSAWSTWTMGWPSKAPSWRGHPHCDNQGTESPKSTALVPILQGVIGPRHPKEDSRLNEESMALFRKERAALILTNRLCIGE